MRAGISYLWIIILLAFLLLFGLGGCGIEKTEEALYGSWSMEYDLSDNIYSVMDSSVPMGEDAFTIKVVLTFMEDGTYKIYADRDSFQESMNTWLESFVADATELLYAECEEKGLTREDTASIFEEKYGCSMQEYLQSTAEAQLDFESMTDEMKGEGIYEAKGNRLYLGSGNTIDEEQYVTFSVEGDTLTLNLPEGDDTLLGMEYPFIFTHQN